MSVQSNSEPLEPDVVLRSVSWDVGKRILDIVIGLAALPIALPVMAVTALLIRLETPGSAVFRQVRVGRGGRPFTIFKLRTMIVGAERIGAGIYAEPNDSRFTRVGTFARRYSLDELPQLFNVLRGDMSLIGPRPMLAPTVAEYAADYRTILEVRPGITGLAQVNGRNALARSERLAFDKEYVRRRSLRLDAWILCRTVVVALRGDGQLNSQGRADVER